MSRKTRDIFNLVVFGVLAAAYCYLCIANGLVKADDKPYGFEADDIPSNKTELKPPPQPPATKPETKSESRQNPDKNVGTNSQPPTKSHNPDKIPSPNVGIQKPAAKSVLKYHTCLRDCAGCKKWHPWAERQKQKKLLLLDFEIVSHKNPDAAYEAVPGITGVPCFELIDTFGQHHFATLSDQPVHFDTEVCPGCVNKWLKWNGKPPVNVQFDRPADVRVAAAGNIGTVKVRPLVRSAFNVIRERIGENVPFGIDWRRNGEQLFHLLRNQNFSLESILGTDSTFILTAKGAKNLPTDSAWVRYEDLGSRYRLTGGAEFLKPNQKAPGASASEPVGFVDPMTLSVLVSLGKALWGIFHPEADIHIGGRVAVTGTLKGDTLFIDFNDGFPNVRFKLLLNFLFGVQRIELSLDKCRILFLPQNFLARWVPFVPKERTILISE